jgi:large subunit ribosomal protein L23
MTLIRPVITEKTIELAEKENQYTFVVEESANKYKIKDAIEEKFNVTVLKVRTINILGKKVNFGQKRIKGKKSDFKKAIVTLKSGDKIDIFNLK